MATESSKQIKSKNKLTMKTLTEVIKATDVAHVNHLDDQECKELAQAIADHLLALGEPVEGLMGDEDDGSEAIRTESIVVG